MSSSNPFNNGNNSEIAWCNQISPSLFWIFNYLQSAEHFIRGAGSGSDSELCLLHRGWQQQPRNYNEARLMWWQDRLPALLSLSFALGLLGVPGLIIQSMYLLCSSNPWTLGGFCLPALYVEARAALKPLLSYSPYRKNRSAASSHSESSSNVQRTNTAFYCSPPALKQSQVFDTGSHHRGKHNQWGRWRLCFNSKQKYGSCVSSSFMLGGKRRPREIWASIRCRCCCVYRCSSQHDQSHDHQSKSSFRRCLHFSFSQDTGV